jgi:hypothetical protein
VAGAVVFLSSIGRAIAINAPQIAHRGQLEVVFVLESRGHAREFGPAVANSDVADGNAIVGPEDAVVGKSCRLDGGPQSH